MERVGYILIADITGYTTYLNESELEHAKGTLTDLLELLIGHIKPPLVVSNLEGDAVFSYGLDAGFVSSQTFLEGIEDMYVAFRRAIELMVLNNTCRCNACANVSALDLKFFVHHGTFALQRVVGRNELIGVDINLIHRLLKNSVTEQTGIRAYTLFTDAARDELGFDVGEDQMIGHVEDVPDFGQIQVWVKDMHPIYEKRRHEERIEYSPEEILFTTEVEVGVPPHVLWDYINQSEIRNLIVASDRYEITGRRDGRIGEGAVYQCYHGKKRIDQLVMEWKPFERVVLEQRLPMPGPPVRLEMDLRLTPIDKGTRLTFVAARLKGSAPMRALTRVMLKMNARRSREDLMAFRDKVEGDFADRGSGELEQSAISPDQIDAAAASSLRAD